MKMKLPALEYNDFLTAGVWLDTGVFSADWLILGLDEDDEE